MTGDTLAAVRPASTPTTEPPPTTIAVAVCTFRRNDPLRRMLRSLERNVDTLGTRAQLGVVIVDDNPDGSAKPIAGEFASSFPLGVHYRHEGHGNISIARNTGLETAITLAEWVAMTDDDMLAPDRWLIDHLDAVERAGADASTGPVYLRVPDDAPSWLTDQPFHEDAQLRFDDGEDMELASTGNSIVRSEFFARRPDLRFREDLGVTGGEDMVFYRTAHREGLKITFCTSAYMEGIDPPERQTLRYQIRSRAWIGNTEWLTNRYLGEASRPWWILRSSKLFGGAAVRPFVRLARSESPQWRYALASMARAWGMFLGAVGVRLDHH